MRNLEVLINEQRRSSVHLDMERPENNQPIVTDKTLNHPTLRRSKSSGVNCSFTADYGRKSPVAKRRREDDKDYSNMKTLDFDPTDDPSYETETLVLSEIAEIVKEKEINEIINKFSPVIRNFPDQIKKEMLESTVGWKEREKMFIGAIKYVIKGREDEQNKENELEGTNIEQLSEILIREIENRMPKYCRKCNMYYIVKPTDRPELHCMWCKVGMHDCTKMNMMKGRPGIKWLCETCEPLFNTHYLSKFDSAAIFEGFDINKVHNSVNKVTETEKEVEILVSQETVQPVKPIRISKKKEMEQNEMDKIQIVAEIHITENETIDDNGTNNQPLPQVDPLQNTNPNGINNTGNLAGSLSPTNYRDVMRYPNMNKDKICHFLARGSCRYGAKGENELGKCQRYHPSQCKKFNVNGITENGCKEGNECQNWHATYICRLSADKNQCSRPNCRFKHHKNCTTTGNNDDYNINSFLAYNQQNKIPRQYQGPQPSRYNKNQSQHQHHYMNRRFAVNRQTGPHHQQWQNRQMPPVPEERLVHLIRAIIQEERNWQ